jgi:hypothetical protein
VTTFRAGSGGYRRAHQLAAIFSKLRTGGGAIKHYGGLRATIGKLRALKHSPNKMLHIGTQKWDMREPITKKLVEEGKLHSDPQIWWNDPRTDSTGMTYVRHYNSKFMKELRVQRRKVRRTGMKAQLRDTHDEK